MIVLDTNVVSELMKAAPAQSVTDWLDAQPVSDLWLTSVTVAELMYGVARLPKGRRRTAVASAIAEMINEDFAGRIHDFDAAAAHRYGEIVVRRETLGRPISMADAEIAAICHVHGATLATRNTNDFADTGIALRDPWQHPVG